MESEDLQRGPGRRRQSMSGLTSDRFSPVFMVKRGPIWKVWKVTTLFLQRALDSL